MPPHVRKPVCRQRIPQRRVAVKPAAAFVEAIASSGDDDAGLLDLLLDQRQPIDAALPDTGVGIELERLLAPVFVRGSAHYGTRASTLAYVRDDGAALIRERTFGREGDTENETAWQYHTSDFAWRRVQIG